MPTWSLFAGLVTYGIISVMGHSSVVEHLTADQEVPSSNLGAPLFFYVLYMVF